VFSNFSNDNSEWWDVVAYHKSLCIRQTIHSILWQLVLTSFYFLYTDSTL
jgi:hypothetical protein